MGMRWLRLAVVLLAFVAVDVIAAWVGTLLGIPRNVRANALDALLAAVLAAPLLYRWIVRETRLRDASEGLRQAEEQVRLLHAVTRTIAEASDYPSALQGLLRAIGESTGWPLGEVWTPSADGRRLEFGAAWTSQPHRLGRFIDASRGRTFSMGELLPGMAWRTRAPMSFDDISRDRRFTRGPQAREAGFKGALAIPVFSAGQLVLVMDFLVLEHKDWKSEPRVAAVHTAALQVGAFILRKRAEDERERIRREFLEAQKMEAVGRLAGGVAHDFANILSAVVGTSELLLGGLKPSDRRYSDLQLIRSSAMHGVSLIKQLLAIGRGRTESMGVWELNAVLSGLEGLLRRVLGESVSLELRLAEGLWPVTSDKGHLEQTVLNLAVNARDAMPQGGRLTVSTSNRTLGGQEASALGLVPGEYVVLSVEDTGLGMAPEVRERIFEPFYTTKPAGTGTGLGLATVHHIVTRGGGRIDVDSAPGRGTRFTLYFPRAKAQAPPPPARPLEAAPTGWRKGAGTLLLVEDDAVVRAVARQILRRAGYTVLAAEDGHKALALAREHRGSLSLLLTDIQLPEMDGFSLARALRRLQPGVPVAYISGYPGPELAVETRGWSPPGGFIAKPFTVETLLKGVGKALAAGTRPAP